jgi:hypothetical protein
MSSPKVNRSRTKKRRDRLASLGLRPIQIWVPDVHSKQFRVEAHRQSLLVASSSRSAADQAFIDSISSFTES